MTRNTPLRSPRIGLAALGLLLTSEPAGLVARNTSSARTGRYSAPPANPYSAPYAELLLAFRGLAYARRVRRY